MRDIEKNVQIECKKCGYNLSDVRTIKGPKGAARIGVCNNCNNITLDEFEENPNYIDINPNNPMNVHCPFCNSTNCKKISTVSKLGKVAMWGVLAAGSASKTWHCNSCGSNFG